LTILAFFVKSVTYVFSKWPVGSIPPAGTTEKRSDPDTWGEASSFAKTTQMIADCKPDVLLLDLHLAEKRAFAPNFVKSQLVGVRNIMAVSFSNDDVAKDLAKSYGASALLDKMSLYHELVPAIMQCH
jgi:hypothetical protein